MPQKISSYIFLDEHDQNLIRLLPILDDILHASEVLDEVFEKYDSYAKFTKEKKKNSNAKGTSTEEGQSSNSESLLDFAGNVGKGDSSAVKSTAGKNTAIDELGDIFSSGSDSNIVEPLKPVTLMLSGKRFTYTIYFIKTNIMLTTSKEYGLILLKGHFLFAEDVDLLGDKPSKAAEGWNELDSLGEQLIKQSLPDHMKRLESFNG